MVNQPERNGQVMGSPKQCFLEPTGPQPQCLKTPGWSCKATFGKPHFPDLLSVSVSCYIAIMPYCCTAHRLNDNNQASNMPGCLKTIGQAMCDGHVVIITTHPTAHCPLGYFRNVQEHVLSFRTGNFCRISGRHVIYLLGRAEQDKPGHWLSKYQNINLWEIKHCNIGTK